MSFALSANYLQSDTERLIEKILEAGMPLEIEYKGKKFLLSVKEAGESAETDCRRSKNTDRLLQDASVSPVSDLSDLAADFWPEDESADDFIDYIYRQRKEDAKE